MHARIRALLLPLQRTPLHPQWLVFRSEPAWFERLAALARGRVLDIGCGRQRVRPFLGPDCDYLGVDYPATGLALYESRPDVFCDAAALPFADASVDAVLLLEVLEHVAGATAALCEAARVLRDGGRLIISVPFLYPIHDAPHDFRRWTRHGLLHEARQQGFIEETLAAYGTSGEVAALTVNLVLSGAALRLLARRHPASVVLLPLVLLVVPLANLLGRLLSWLDSGDEMAACGYRAIFRKAAPSSRP